MASRWRSLEFRFLLSLKFADFVRRRLAETSRPGYTCCLSRTEAMCPVAHRRILGGIDLGRDCGDQRLTGSLPKSCLDLVWRPYFVISYDAAGTPYPAMLFLNRDWGPAGGRAASRLRRKAWTAKRWPDTPTTKCQ